MNCHFSLKFRGNLYHVIPSSSIASIPYSQNFQFSIWHFDFEIYIALSSARLQIERLALRGVCKLLRMLSARWVCAHAKCTAHWVHGVQLPLLSRVSKQEDH